MTQSMSHVDTFGLAKVGAAVTQASAGYDKAFKSRAAGVTGAGVLDNWSTGTALAGAASAWSQFLSQLTSQIDTMGTDLSRAAEQYRAADQAAGNRISVAGHSPVAY